MQYNSVKNAVLKKLFMSQAENRGCWDNSDPAHCEKRKGGVCSLRNG